MDKTGRTGIIVACVLGLIVLLISGIAVMSMIDHSSSARVIVTTAMEFIVMAAALAVVMLPLVIMAAHYARPNDASTPVAIPAREANNI